MTAKTIIFIAGPTAVGKSDAALAVAERLRGEIVSCDSMQVYREIRVASNKPSPDIMTKIRHHLVDVISVEDEFDAATFNRLATAAIQSIQERGKVPVVVGGSGMYMQVLLDGIFDGVSKNPQLRHELEQTALQEGHEALHAQLRDVDPEAAAGIHLNDTRRIIRALEVYLTTRQPMSVLKKSRSGLWGNYDIRIFALTRSRDDLYARINQRVDDMFQAGLVEEIKALGEKKLSLTAQRIIGVREVTDYLQGHCDIERAGYLMKLHTRHFAKRQLTWLRKETRAQWVTIDPGQEVAPVVENMIRDVSK